MPDRWYGRVIFLLTLLRFQVRVPPRLRVPFIRRTPIEDCSLLLTPQTPWFISLPLLSRPSVLLFGPIRPLIRQNSVWYWGQMVLRRGRGRPFTGWPKSRQPLIILLPRLILVLITQSGWVALTPGRLFPFTGPSLILILVFMLIPFAVAFRRRVLFRFKTLICFILLSVR